MLFLVLLVPVSASGRTLIGSQVEHLYGVEPYLQTYDYSTLFTHPGSNLYNLKSYDHSTINIQGGDSIHIEGYDFSKIKIVQGEHSFIGGEDSVEIDLSFGSFSSIEGRGDCNITINDSKITFLKGLENSSVDVEGAELTFFKIAGNSLSTLHDLVDLTSLIVGDNSVVTIYGSHFSYHSSTINGRWENGNNFSFHVSIENSTGSSGSTETIPNNVKFIGPLLYIDPTVPGGNGSTSPAVPQGVNFNETAEFTLIPDEGFHIDTVQGTCGGTLFGDVYTTSNVLNNCTVQPSFAFGDLIVTPSAIGGHGTISPDIPQNVAHNDTSKFILEPDEGYMIGGITGTCGGTREGKILTTSKITKNCSIQVEFIEYSFPWVLFNSLFQNKKK
jgi:hypothetical protein